MSVVTPEISLEHLDDATFFVGTDLNDRVGQPMTAEHHHLRDKFLSEVGRIASEIAAVPHDETGLNIPRMSAFMESQGLELHPFMGVDEAGAAEISKIIGATPDKDILTTGSSLSLLGIVWVLRGRREAAAGQTAVETTGIHEGWHVIQPPPEVICCDRPDYVGGVAYTMRRQGLKHFGAGQLLGPYWDEASAEYAEHKYITQPAGLGMPNGLLDRTEPKRVGDDNPDSYMMPGSYMFRDSSNGKPRWRTPSHASYGMQLLVAQNPDIWDAHVASKTDPDGRRQLRQSINEIDSGLYDYLDNCRYDGAAFRASTFHIISRVYGGNQDAALEAAFHDDSRYAGGLMAA